MKIERKARIMNVPLDAMYVRSGISQRPFRAEWAAQLATDFDPALCTRPIVNRVGDRYWIVDGQHRIHAIKAWLGEWHGQKVECEVYEDLDERHEAVLFDLLNTMKPVSAYDRFVVRLTAEFEEETNVAAILRLKKLKLNEQKKGEGAISCVRTLLKVYRRGADCLARDLEIAYQAFGDNGLDADIIDGIGLLVSRYNGRLNDKQAIEALTTVRGGVNALRSRAERLRQQTGVQRGQCIAAAAVEIINRGKGGKKLPGWFKVEES